MVQIMNGSGHCSRNRAERASLDGKPEYPDGTATSTPINQSLGLPSTAETLIPHVTPTVATIAAAVGEDEEYEAYGQNGTQGSTLRTPEETNNNLSDSEEKDWGVIVAAHAWAATSSFVTPQFDDDDDEINNDKDDPLKLDNISGMPTLETINDTNNSRSPFLFQYSKSVVSPRKKRRRKKSKGSTSSTLSSTSSRISCKSTKSLQSQQQPSSIRTIETRRQSTPSTSTSTDGRIRMDSIFPPHSAVNVESKSKQTSAAAAEICSKPLGATSSGSAAVVQTNESSPTSSTSTTGVPYCYRCYLKFAKYSHWKKHAIYEHILAKNPYPIVEMNYIDPASLGIEITPSTEEVEERSAFDAENAFIDENALCDTDPETGTTSSNLQHGSLRLCIGKEKGGAYVVKEKKSLGSLDNGSDDNSCPPVLEASSPPNPTPPFNDPTSPDLVMPMLKPCPALTSKLIPSHHAPNNNNSNTLLPPPPLLETANLEARYRRMVSIESELETVLNIAMEEDFETALEVATERSRRVATDNTLHGGISGSGGIVVPFSGIHHNHPSSMMISEEVNPSALGVLVSEVAVEQISAKDASQDDKRSPNILLNELLNRKHSPEFPNLVKGNAGGDNNGSSSDSSKDSEASDENISNITEKNNDSVCDTRNNVQSIDVSIGKDKDVDAPISEQNSNSSTDKSVGDKITAENNSDASSEKENSPRNDEDSEKDKTPSIHQMAPPVPPSQKTTPPAEGNDDDGESDALQCRVCQKVFMSDDELEKHFSEDHFRLAGGMGILEPESPYPPPQTPQQPSIFSGEDDEQPMNIRASQQNQQQQQPQISVTRSFAVNSSNSNVTNMQGGRNGPPPPPNMSLPQQQQQQPNLMIRRPSNENLVIHNPTYTTAQEELQNMMWRNQVNVAQAQQQQQQQQRAHEGLPRGFPAANPNNPGNAMRPMGGHRISPPNMTVGGMPSRTNGPPNNPPHPQSMLRQQPPPPSQQVHYTTRPPQYGGPAGSQQSQRLPIQAVQAHHRVSPPQYSMSLHNALTGTPPHYTNQSSIIRPGGNNNMVQQQQQSSRPPSQPGGPIRQMHPNPYQQQQQQNVMRGGMPPSTTTTTTVRAPAPPLLGQTIGMNQQMLNQMNAQRELNSQFQQRLAGPMGPHPQSMPRLQQQQQQQIPQQRVAPAYPQQQQQQQQQHRPSPLSQKRPISMSCIEISEVRSNKEPRMENSQQQQQQRSQIAANNNNVSAAIGSVGNAGINSVRLGNSITLSVCPTTSSANSSAHSSPATSPALRGEPTNIRQSISSTSSCGSGTVSPAASHHMSSVLAVRGVTVTPASPVNTSGISPVSSPSPCNSPAAGDGTPSPGVYPSSSPHHQQIHHNHIIPQQGAQSVIQRIGSISPENPRDKNFSPPVITTVRGNAHQVIPHNNNHNLSQQSHNFAVPRPPPPIQRGISQGHPSPHQHHSPSSSLYSVNNSADRPERPPTVDLTDDNVQAHVNQQQAQQHRIMNGIITQQQQQQQQQINQQSPTIRRFVTAQTANLSQSQQQQPRPLTARLPSCNICNLLFPSIQSLEGHKLTNHNVPRPNNPPQQSASPATSSTSPSTGGPRPQMAPTNNMGQLPHPPPPNATTVRSTIMTSRPPLNPGGGQQISHHQHRPASGPNNSLLRNHQSDSQMQIRSQSPNRPQIQNSANQNQGKYLYIPLLDLGRIDANKMRKLEEIGISCVVPLQGNNAMTSMGIPVMSLRGEGALGQHVPWDSVLPMGPVHVPSTVNETQQQGNNNLRQQ